MFAGSGTLPGDEPGPEKHPLVEPAARNRPPPYTGENLK
jgi:hypothetical protein